MSLNVGLEVLAFQRCEWQMVAASGSWLVHDGFMMGSAVMAGYGCSWLLMAVNGEDKYRNSWWITVNKGGYTCY